jgi:hypothetical protein
MARTITNGNTKSALSTFELKAYDGSTWIDIGDRTRAITLEYDHGGSTKGVAGSGRWIATAEIINTQNYRDANLSLDPGHTSSYNGGVPLLGAYHQIRLNIGKGGASAVRMFEGYAGPGEIGGMEDVEQEDVLSADFVDGLQPYADFWIPKKEGRTYEDTYISSAGNALNDMLANYGFARKVVLEDDPSYYLYKYEIGDINMLDVIQNPIHSIGYSLMWKWNDTYSEFRPTVVDPDRENTTEDIDLSGDIQIIYTSYSEANVRTKLELVYQDRTSQKEAFVVSSDSTALATYGIPDGLGGRLHKYMRIVMKEGSVIDTYSEAAAAAERALHDVSQPCPNVEVRVPWLVLGVEGGDLIKCTSHTETVKIGVTGIMHRIENEGDRLGSTTITGTLDYRIGNRRYWFLKGRTDLLGKLEQDYIEQHSKWPDAPSEVDSSGVWGDAEDASAAPILFTRWSGKKDWATAGYEIKYRQAESKDSGTSTSGTVYTLTDSSKSWIEHEWMGCYIYVTTSTRGGEDQVREIMDNDATTIKWRTPLDTAVTTEDYHILYPIKDWQTVRGDRYPFKEITGLPSGVYVITKVRIIPYGVGR